MSSRYVTVECWGIKRIIRREDLSKLEESMRKVSEGISGKSRLSKKEALKK